MPKKDGSLTLKERNTAPECLGSDKRCNSFCCILYPDDAKHERILQMLLRYPQIYRLVYILHDRDVYLQRDIDAEILKYGEAKHEVGESKKAHYHVFIRYKNSVSPSSFSNSLGGIFVEAVSDSYSYLRYMLHDTPDSWDEFSYLPQDLRGDSKLIGMLSQRNDYYIQLSHLCNLFDCEHGLRHLVNYVTTYPQYSDTFERFQNFLIAVNSDERSRSFERFRACYDDIIKARDKADE